MRFHPRITFEQYAATCRAVAGAKPGAVRRRSWKGYVGLGVACLAFGISLQVPGASVVAFTVFATLILGWVLSKPLTRQSQERCLRAIFAEEQGMLNDQVLTVDESGISCDMGGGKATSHHAWNVFMRRIDMPDAYIFLPSPNSFIRVPKETFSLSELELVWRWSSGVPVAGAGPA